MSLAMLVGDRHSGKTTACRRLVEAAEERGLIVAGIVSAAMVRDGKVVGYEVIHIATNESAVLATLDGPGAQRVGRFHFRKEGLGLGRHALSGFDELDDSLVIVDEVGPLELSGGGWAELLPALAERAGLTLLTVRRTLASEVARTWGVSPEAIFDLADGPNAIVAAILRRVTVRGP